MFIHYKIVTKDYFECGKLFYTCSSFSIEWPLETYTLQNQAKVSYIHVVDTYRRIQLKRRCTRTSKPQRFFFAEFYTANW